MSVKDDVSATSYLTPRASSFGGDSSLSTYLVDSLSADELVESFGKTPPIEVVPPALQDNAARTSTTSSVLDEIARTGVLKVGIRRDSSPFGYIDSDHNWSGYCRDLSQLFARQLEDRLDIDGQLEVVFLPSNLETRFQLIRERTVHAECGPTTIQDGIEGVAFSNPFFLTGTQFLTTSDGGNAVNPALDLADTQIGVLGQTTTASFIEEQYPRANTRVFEGPIARKTAIQSLQNGQIDAFATDGVLALGEVISQQLPLDDFQLIPERPLTCEYYGLIVPDGDDLWLETINRWLGSDNSRRASHIWLSDKLPTMLLDFDHCLNRVS